MADEKPIVKTGMGLGSWLFLLFLALKLTGFINWSWWWVTAPLWIPLSIMVFCLLLLFIIYGAASYLDRHY